MTRRMPPSAKLPALLAGLVLSLAWLAPHPALAETEERIAVLVNGQPISAYDIDQRERFMSITTHQPPSAALRKKSLDMLIQEQLQLQAGAKMKLFPNEREVNAVLNNMAKQNHLTEATLAAALAHLGVNISTLKNRIRAELVWQQVIRQKFAAMVSVDPAAIDKALKKAGDKVDIAAKTTVNVITIRFSVPRHASPADIARRLAEADTMHRRFRSCGATKILLMGFKGVTLNRATKKASEIPEPGRTLVLKANPGQMTAPTIDGSSVALYAVCGKSAAEDAPMRQVAERALMNQQYKAKAEGYMRQLKQDAFIQHLD